MKQFTQQQIMFIDRMVDSSQPFLLCALPSALTFTLYTQGPMTDAPFHTAETAAVAIGDFHGNVFAIDSAEDKRQSRRLFPSTDFAGYSPAMERVISRLKVQGGKTVVSRVIAGNCNRRPSEVADDYFSNFPETFRFMFFTPATGLWLGASPELLLDNNLATGMASTIALAGTRPHGITEPWDAKNAEEHRIVVDYISTTLSQFGMDPHCKERTTRRFGPIEHLLTPITASASSRPLDVINALSPTPALSGYPKEVAIAEIDRTEGHSRQCYGGYIALDLGNGHTIAFVNLRSAHLEPDGNSWRFNIYAGGGITADSIIADEWTEATLKSETLRRVLTAPPTQHHKHINSSDPNK